MKTREREGERGRERELAGTYMTSSKRWLRGVEAPSQTSGSTLFKMETKRVRKSLKKKNERRRRGGGGGGVAAAALSSSSFFSSFSSLVSYLEHSLLRCELLDCVHCVGAVSAFSLSLLSLSSLSSLSSLFFLSFRVLKKVYFKCEVFGGIDFNCC